MKQCKNIRMNPKHATSAASTFKLNFIILPNEKNKPKIKKETKQ